MTVEGRVFISYSRRQLYFAEALSKRLQKAGVDCWMDLQQLEPGSDWETQIRAALESCTALVLVASRQALASPYVQEEWRTAQARSIPVYIALYEAVHLPQALQNASLIDFRGRFKPAVETLADCLTRGRTVREPAPRPNRLNLPTRLPPGIRLITLALILSALVMPPLTVDSFPPVFHPLLLLINGLVMSVLLLWWTWRFLHHRFQLQVAAFPVLLPFVIYGFYRMSDAIQYGFGDEFFIEWMLLIGASILTYLISFLILGPGLLRWSAPGDNEFQLLRRWFNKPARRKNRKATTAMLNSMLAARTDGPVSAPVSAPSQEAFRVAPEPEPASPETYSLRCAPNDRPVAGSLRRALRKQKLREVERGGDVRILVLSQYLPRIQLKETLGASVRKVLLLAGNVSLRGDALLEQVTRLQIIDFRERSGKTLSALARTLKDPDASNLPVGLEATPKSFHETLLPPGARQIGYWVMSAGVYLLLSGLAALVLGLTGLLPLEPLDLPGLLIGPWLIRQGRGFWSRRATRWAFIPAFAFSAWLSIMVLFLAFFLFSFDLPPNPLQWILTPSKLLVLNEDFPLLCFLPFTFFLIPFMLLDHIVRYRNWLPASARQAKDQPCLPPLPDKRAPRWVLLGWLAGAFLAFGLPLAIYAIYYFLFQVIRSPF